MIYFDESLIYYHLDIIGISVKNLFFCKHAMFIFKFNCNTVKFFLNTGSLYYYNTYTALALTNIYLLYPTFLTPMPS